MHAMSLAQTTDIRCEQSKRMSIELPPTSTAYEGNTSCVHTFGFLDQTRLFLLFDGVHTYAVSTRIDRIWKTLQRHAAVKTNSNCPDGDDKSCMQIKKKCVFQVAHATKWLTGFETPTFRKPLLSPRAEPVNSWWLWVTAETLTSKHNVNTRGLSLHDQRIKPRSQAPAQPLRQVSINVGHCFATTAQTVEWGKDNIVTTTTTAIHSFNSWLHNQLCKCDKVDKQARYCHTSDMWGVYSVSETSRRTFLCWLSAVCSRLHSQLSNLEVCKLQTVDPCHSILTAVHAATWLLCPATSKAGNNKCFM